MSIKAISQDRVLQIYGCFIAAFTVLTAIAWLYGRAEHFLTDPMDAICWPMFDQCRVVHVLSKTTWQWIFGLFAFLGLLNVALFTRQRTIPMAWGLLLLLNIAKYFIVFSDYRLRLNQHLMAFWITAAFLFFPDKKKSLKLLIMMFYFWAGIIKMGPDWLTGAALYDIPWFLNNRLLPWACGYVVVLEVLFIWGLLWDRSRVAWAVLAQLVLFHLMSFKVVGFFYPMLMYAMLSIFPLCWYYEKNTPTLWSELKLGQVHNAALCLVLAFSLLQMWPKMYPGRTTLTGEGRLFSLHMFDAKTECHATGYVHTDTGELFNINFYKPLANRIHCDPIVYLNRAHNFCEKNRHNQKFVNLDIKLESKTTTDSAYQTIFELHDFCTKPVAYSMFHPNLWLNAQ